MKPADVSACAALERVFHEPGRLAIMSALCAAAEGLSFVELKEQCGLTDGNLNRHLKTLDEARAVRIRKSFVESRPRTTVSVTASGRRDFAAYLRALEQVLKTAAQAAAREERASPSAWAKTARA
jgi:DNA-binding MarR family transcriptional regulator